MLQVGSKCSQTTVYAAVQAVFASLRLVALFRNPIYSFEIRSSEIGFVLRLQFPGEPIVSPIPPAGKTGSRFQSADWLRKTGDRASAG